MIEIKERSSLGYAIGDEVKLHDIPSGMKSFLTEIPDYEERTFEIVKIDWMTVEEENGPFVANVLHLVDINGDRSVGWAIEDEFVKEKVN